MDEQTEYSFNQIAPRINPFSVASLGCGILSVLLCCTGLLGIPFGALGILFALLSRRLNKATPPMSATGLLFSGVGLALGFAVTIYTAFYIWNDPELRNALLQYYQQY